jgi:hypothetical protein
MSVPISLSYAASSNTAIAPLQSPSAGELFQFNNTDQSGNPIDSFYVGALTQQFVIPFFARPVTLTSAGDDSAINYTLSGVDINGAPLNEVLAGPNAATVQSVNSYHALYSVIGDANTTSPLSIGIASSGTSQPITLDKFRNNSASSLIEVIPNGATYTVQGTAQAPLLGFGIGSSVGGVNQPATIISTITWNSIPAFTAKTANILATANNNYTALRITVAGAQALKMYVYQPGLV